MSDGVRKTVSKSKDEKDSDAFVFWLFKKRCIICKKPASEINEILLRSRSKDAVINWKNRVPLCREHHEEYHKDGVTDKKMKDMTDKRKEYLVSIGKEDYV